jgi:O-antigen ligase
MMRDRDRVRDGLIGGGLVLALGGVARGEELVLRLVALALLVALAWWRPTLVVLLVPLSAPLALIPAQFALAGRTLLVPLHELALLVAVAAAVLRAPRLVWHELRDAARRRAPLLLIGVALLLAGLLGVAFAMPDGRGAALREWRWMLLEPLLFLWLLRRTPGQAWRAARAFIIAGVLVAAVAWLQWVGIDLAPRFGEKQNFGTPNVVEVDGVRRVTSVYGHPNNLGLTLGRLWPLALVAALLAHHRAARLAWAAATLLILGGVALSFSRGAWIGALAAGLVLGGALAGRWRRSMPLLLAGAVLLGGAVLVIGARGGLGGGSVTNRALLWQEALGLLARHPLGLGPDQFYFWHNPEFGRSTIDPALIGTSDQYASHPHQGLLEIWLAVGPIGLLALLAGGGLALRRAWRTVGRGDWRGAAILAAAAAAVTHGMVDQLYFVEDLALIFWLLVALAWQLPAADAPAPEEELHALHRA